MKNGVSLPGKIIITIVLIAFIIICGSAVIDITKMVPIDRPDIVDESGTFGDQLRDIRDQNDAVWEKLGDDIDRLME